MNLYSALPTSGGLITDYYLHANCWVDCYLSVCGKWQHVGVLLVWCCSQAPTATNGQAAG